MWVFLILLDRMVLNKEFFLLFEQLSIENLSNVKIAYYLKTKHIYLLIIYLEI